MSVNCTVDMIVTYMDSFSVVIATHAIALARSRYNTEDNSLDTSRVVVRYVTKMPMQELLDQSFLKLSSCSGSNRSSSLQFYW